MTDPFDQLAPWYDALYVARGKDFDAEAASVLAVIAAARGGRPPTSLLDVACGTGAHLAAFATAVPVVAGIDAHPGMLALARRRLPEADLVNGDMRTDLRGGPPMDAVTCLFASIGYLPDEPALRDAVAAMADRLAPGGVLVLEPPPFPDEATPPRRQHTSCERDGHRCERVTTARRVGDTLHIRFSMRIIAPDGTAADPVQEQHVVRLFSRNAIEAAVRAAGLQVRFDRRTTVPTRLFVAVAAAVAPPPGDTISR